MMRKGRFDEIFFVDLPTYIERKEILKLHLARRLKNPEVIGDFVVNDSILSQMAKTTEGFVGAELEQVVISGLFEAFYEGRSITLKDFESAISFTVPLSVTQSEEIHRLREWANVRAVAATQNEDRTMYAVPDQPVKETGNKEHPGSGDVLSSRGGRPIDF